MSRLWLGCLLVLSSPVLASDPQPPPALAELEPLVGTWISRLDPKYKDHPMVRRFNPDLKSQELRLSWGVDRKTLHLQVWQLDRPSEGDRRLSMEGMVFWNPADESVVLVEYNAEQDIFFQGRYQTLPSGEVHRTYDAFFTGNQSRRFREIWRWKGSARREFEWITQHQDGEDWISGDVIVDWVRQEP